MKYEKFDTTIPTVGNPKVDSPIQAFVVVNQNGEIVTLRFISDQDQVLVYDTMEYLESLGEGEKPLSFEPAGPRAKIYFDPTKLRCAIVTCGGLCPGTNDVIRALVLELHYLYKVPHIYGIRYGLQGFIPKYGHDVVKLTPHLVANIHNFGGTILSSSRGPQDTGEIVDALERLDIGILFAIGGDGTLRAVNRICDEVTSRQLRTSVIAIPKTIDNDIALVSRSFGFDTAVEMATEAIRSAHTEALGAPNGIGLVKLMGRHAGFIAATATLALREVNFVLIPESDFDLEGEHGFLVALEKRLADRSHAVIVVAEGTGQKYFDKDKLPRDASGNIKPGDIAGLLIDKINHHFSQRHLEINLKFIDPSYIIRSMPANYNDRIYCGYLAQSAVHAGMAGKTGMLISLWREHYVHIPIKAAVGKHRHVQLDAGLWCSVLESTGQPPLKNPVSLAPVEAR